MIFWSSFAKKVKESISKKEFKALEKKVDTNTSDIQTNKANITDNLAKINTNTANITNNTRDIATNRSNIANNTRDITTNRSNITANTNKISAIETGLKDGNIVNYAGVYDASTTYKLAQAITHNDLWYVSNVDGNRGNTPTGQSNQYWELISAPVVNLTEYPKRTEIQANYYDKTYIDGNYYTRGAIDSQFVNYYTKTYTEDNFARKSAIGVQLKRKDFAFNTWRQSSVRNDSITRRIWEFELTGPTLTGISLGNVQNVVFFNNTNRFIRYDWSVNQYYSVLRFTLINQLSQDNVDFSNCKVSVYYY